MENLTVTTSNNLIFKRVENNKKVNCEIKISLNDECKNGHQDFYITATFWEIGKPRNDKYFYTAGSCHDEILKHFPEYKIFVDLHGCDYLGVPLHCVANGFYFLTAGFSKTKPNDKNFKKEYCDYYRINANQFDALNVAKDENYYGFLLLKLGVLEQWKNEAKKAILELEKLTNKTFMIDSTKLQFNMTEEKLQEIEKQVKEGFYSDENINQRFEQSKIEKKTKLLQDRKTTFDAKSLELLQDYEIDKIAIDLFLTDANIIFYKHKNTIVFNWQSSSYNKQYSETEFKMFLDVAKENEYLKNCEFELINNK